MKSRNYWILAPLLAALYAPAHAANISVDGSLSDWGLHQNGNANDWTPMSGVAYNVVDDNTANGPGEGGQKYDAEAIYSYVNNSTLYLALVTGLPSSGENWAPGDFAIDLGNNGSFDLGVKTIGSNAGKVYQVSQWGGGLFDANGAYNPGNPDPAHPTSIVSGTEIGTGQLVYTTNPIYNLGQHASDAHYVIEAAIPLSVLAGFSGQFGVHWTMGCANNAIALTSELITSQPGPSPVPEPGTVALILLGLATLITPTRQGRYSLAVA